MSLMSCFVYSSEHWVTELFITVSWYSEIYVNSLLPSVKGQVLKGYTVCFFHSSFFFFYFHSFENGRWRKIGVHGLSMS